MKNTTTYYQFILDVSGSMSNIRFETIESYNAHIRQIQTLKKDHPNQEFLVSLCLFNNHVISVFEDVSLEKIKLITPEDYIPLGSTALLDAIGKCTYRIKQEHGKQIDADEASVVTIIITDGEENASRVFNFQEISRMISDLEKTENWTFTFLGAEINAELLGKMLSIKRQNTKTFMKDEIHNTMSEISHSMKAYACHKERGERKKWFF
jgi:uncharacterized protein YegL